MANTCRSLFGDSHDAILVVVPDTGRVVYQNDAAITLFGRKLSELPFENISFLPELMIGARPVYRTAVEHETRGEIRLDIRYGGEIDTESDGRAIYLRCEEVLDTARSTHEFIRRARDPVTSIVGTLAILEKTELTSEQKQLLSHVHGETELLKKLFQTEDLRNWQERPRGDLQVLNYDGLLGRVGGKREIADEVIENIRESLLGHVQQCRAALDKNDLPTLRQTAHTIKGSAGTAGAELVADRASQINKIIRKGETDLEVLGSFISDLEEASREFLSYISDTRR